MKRKTFQALTVIFLAAALLADPAQAATPEIQVGSYKGNTLETGERSLLIIDPAGAEYTASSSNPEAIAVERVLTYWVAKAEGMAEIVVINEAGTTGILTLTVGSAEAANSSPKGASVPAETDTPDLSTNMDIRPKMARLINEVRRKNGLAELCPRTNPS